VTELPVPRSSLPVTVFPTAEQNLTKRVEIVLPAGSVAVPMRVARDKATGITLLKISVPHPRA
jgi:hypothetical protein